MATLASLKQAIVEEQQRREPFDVAGLGPLIESEGSWEAVKALVLFWSPARLLSQADWIRQEIAARLSAADQDLQGHNLRFLTDVTLALRSFLPRWNLQDAQRHAGAALSDPQVEGEVGNVQKLTVDLAARAPAAAERPLDQWWVTMER